MYTHTALEALAHARSSELDTLSTRTAAKPPTSCASTACSGPSRVPSASSPPSARRLPPGSPGTDTAPQF